jgi:4a-hydroxytetrahydrobiopterin dehydratase
VSDLAQKKCIPCSGGIPRLDAARVAELALEVPGWQVVNNHHLQRRWSFTNFATALAFVNRIGEVAEREAHHPNISFTWGRVDVEIYTHKIDGLTESDFILAAKLGDLATA